MIRPVHLAKLLMPLVLSYGPICAQSASSEPAVPTARPAVKAVACTKECKRTRTAEGFRALSIKCRQRSTDCGAKAARLEQELVEYQASHHLHAKYPPREESLRDLIYYHRTRAARWNDLSAHYGNHAAQLEQAGIK